MLGRWSKAGKYLLKRYCYVAIKALTASIAQLVERPLSERGCARKME